MIGYTRGELFPPMAVEEHIASSALDEGAGQGRRVLVGRGRLTPELIPLSVEHVGAPLGRSAYRAWKKRPDRGAFVA